jgi:hypothetical protein
MRRHLLHGVWRPARAPQQQIYVGPEADAAVTRRRDGRRRFVNDSLQLRATLRALGLGQPSPGGVGAQAEKMDKVA